MQEEKTTLRRIKEVKRCFVKKGESYRLHDTKYVLPSIPKKYEEVLKERSIAYEIVTVERKKDLQQFCKYWDKEKYEEVEVELPVYEYKNGLYHYVGKHKGNVPTKSSVVAAWLLKKVVDAEIEEKKYGRNVTAIKQAIGNESAIYVKKGQLSANLEEGRLANYQIFINKKENGEATSDIIIFDLNKLSGNVELCIPEHAIKRVLGKNNENAKKWVNTLKIDQLKIIPIY